MGGSGGERGIPGAAGSGREQAGCPLPPLFYSGVISVVLAPVGLHLDLGSGELSPLAILGPSGHTPPRDVRNF